MGFRSAGFRRESALPLGGRAGVPWGGGWCPWKFLRQTCSWSCPLTSRSWLHMPAHTKSTSAAAGEKAWLGAGLGFDRGMYAQINA